MFDLSILGVEKNIPKVNFTDYSGIFIAEPKFGKTTTASKFPKSIIVPFEDGTKRQVANVVKKMSSWNDFISFVNKLEENRLDIGDDIQTIVFDTITKAYDMCEPYTLRQLGRADNKTYKKPSEVPHGGFYPARDKFFNKEISRLHALGFSTLFLVHSKVKTIKPKNAEPYDVYSSTMPDRLEQIIMPLVDFIMYGERRVIGEEAKRVLVTKSSDMSASGSRVYLEEDIDFDTEDEAMEKYQEAFKQSIMKVLKEHGIEESFEEISERQHREKMEKIESEAKEKSEKLGSTQIVDEISENVSKMTKEQQDELKKQLKAEFKSVNYKKYPEENLVRALEITKEILG